MNLYIFFACFRIKLLLHPQSALVERIESGVLARSRLLFALRVGVASTDGKLRSCGLVIGNGLTERPFSGAR